MNHPYLPPGGPPQPPWGPQSAPPPWQGFGAPAGSWQPAPPPPPFVAPPGYGQQLPPGFRPPPPRRRKPSPLPWILSTAAVGVVVVAVILFLGFLSPGWFYRTVFDAGSVQKGVEQVLKTSYRVQGVASASCPPGQPVKPSHTFSCQVSVAGQQKTVSITVKDERGTYGVSQPR